MAETYKARFGRIERNFAQTVGDTPRLFAAGIHMAMDLRDHPAAYRWPGGVGMLSVMKDPGEISHIKSADVLAAVVDDDGTVRVESHHAAGVVGHDLSGPCGVYQTYCYSLELPPEGDLIDRMGNLKDFSRVYRFGDGLERLVAPRTDSGEVVLPTDMAAIVTEIGTGSGHRFQHPAIENFVRFALSDVAR